MSHPKWTGRLVARARALLAEQVRAGTACCRKCGGAVTPGQLWDVDHIVPRDVAPHLTDDPTNWAVAHRYCNRRAGAVYGNRKRGHQPRPPQPPPTPSRDW